MKLRDLRKPKKASMIVGTILAMWLVTLLLGFKVLVNYESRPGPNASSPARWPAATKLRLDRGHANLLLFLHPRCSCSEATVTELTRLLTRYPGRLAIQVMMYKPTGFSDSWVQTGLWDSVASLPSVALRVDDGGAEAIRFHALTSGQTLLYDEQGHLIFSGGITQGRGHIGDNAGSRAIAHFLDSRSTVYVTTPAFGCYLRSQVEGPGKEESQ